ncbi:MAG: hypothetical protein HC895_01495 [Leptolyngbyaceae cyanobacterium SM1_3_5]|nr:hypothetical protein [Leptolyngbyaceae cyanobacterium SM1_3_5]
MRLEFGVRVYETANKVSEPVEVFSAQFARVPVIGDVLKASAKCPDAIDCRVFEVEFYCYHARLSIEYEQEIVGWIDAVRMT